MALARGTRLGRYEILAALGSGGMGEVYRARDPRLQRDVAVKVVASETAADASRLARLEQEALATARLNHPNILAVYDVGVDGTAPYIVSELLEGQSLRARLAEGALPVRKALEYTVQLTRGLAAAHAAGIIHRDLKPENVFVTRDGHVKILDFGLAKLTASAPTNATRMPTAIATEPGAVLGSVAYMAPEQVRGQGADHRADIFAVGAMLYEMLTGRRPFDGVSPADTMSAILKDDPPEIARAGVAVPPSLDRLVRRCLEKDPADRFHSTHDLGLALEALATPSSDVGVPAERAAAERRGRPLRASAVLLVLLACVPLAFLFGRITAPTVGDREPAAGPAFQRLTFRRGTIESARFAPDGRTIIYAAGWDGGPLDLFSTLPGSTESRSLQLGATSVLSISPSGEMALLMRREPAAPLETVGTLARAPLAGGVPRELVEGVAQADWNADGSALAIVHRIGATRERLEYPIDTPLYETAGWIGEIRISADGDRVAFIDHALQDAAAGDVTVVDRRGTKKVLSRGWLRIAGLAWSPRGDEIWFAATRVGSSRAVYAVDLEGRERLILRVAGALTLHDVAHDGRLLLTSDVFRREMRARAPAAETERDLSWLDYSVPRDISRDGTQVLFHEAGEGGGEAGGLYVRRTDGAPAVRLADAVSGSLSADGRWALGVRRQDRTMLMIPTGVGDTRTLDRGVVSPTTTAAKLLGAQHVVFVGQEPGHGTRVYMQSIAGKDTRALTPEGVSFRNGEAPAAPDGRFVAAHDPNRRLVLYPVTGGEPRPVAGALPGDLVSGWTHDGRAMYVTQITWIPAQLDRISLDTGQRERWRELRPPDLTGVAPIDSVHVAENGTAYVYSYIRTLSDLYVVSGIQPAAR
jgi:eukaryotic-like serine/threonine-protein kinase